MSRLSKLLIASQARIVFAETLFVVPISALVSYMTNCVRNEVLVKELEVMLYFVHALAFAVLLLCLGLILIVQERANNCQILS